MKKNIACAVAAAAGLTGCAFDGGGELAAGTETLEERLLTREFLALEPTSAVGVQATDGEGNELPCLQPTVVGGTAVLRSTESGLLLVEDLDVQLSDVQIRAEILGSEPIHLTDIVLRLGTQLVTAPTWGEGGIEAAGSGDADLILDWAMRTRDGEVYPLATQRLADTDFGVQASLRADGTIAAHVQTAIAGDLSNFANRIILSDFSMAVTAVTEPTTVQPAR
jgi:hypothetical protein